MSWYLFLLPACPQPDPDWPCQRDPWLCFRGNPCHACCEDGRSPGQTVAPCRSPKRFDEPICDYADDRKDVAFMSHVHAIEGVTTCGDCHCHAVHGVSTPEMEVDCRHFHEIRDRTTFEDGHWHVYQVRTGLDIDLPEGFHTHKASFITNDVDEHAHHFKGFVEALSECEEDRN